MTKLMLAIPLLALAACAPKTAYVDANRAVFATQEFKDAQADAEAYKDSRMSDYNVAVAAVKKASDAKDEAGTKAAQAKQDVIAKETNEEIKHRLDVAGEKIWERMRSMVSQLAPAVIPLQAALYIDPSLDMTATLAARYDQSDRELATLRKENATLRASQATPPSKPVAVNGTKQKGSAQ